jgi:hypothetical protein
MPSQSMVGNRYLQIRGKSEVKGQRGVEHYYQVEASGPEGQRGFKHYYQVEASGPEG